MNTLDHLEQVIEQERDAILNWDWQGLESCAQLKQDLAEQLSQQGIKSDCQEQAQRIRHATQHNVQVASNLSKQLKGLLYVQQKTPTYNRTGQLSYKPQVMLSYQG